MTNDDQPTNTELTTSQPPNAEPISPLSSNTDSAVYPSSGIPPTPSQPSGTERTRSRRRNPSIIGPLILITIGVLFLLANLGYITGSFWLTLVQFWPLILILVGIEILFGRSLVGQLVVLLIGLLVIGGVVWYVLNPGQFAFAGGLTTTQISETQDGVQSAALGLDLGVGELELGPLDPGSPDWIQGTISTPTNRQIKQDSGVTSGEANLKISTEGSNPVFGNPSERWNIKLSPTIPVNLSVYAGVGGATLDLNGLNIPQLAVNTGVGGMQVTLPSHAGTVNAVLEGGVGGMTVLIPQGVPARIRSSTGLGGLTINQSRFPAVGQDLYESPDYATATDRIDLSVDSGVGGITIP